MTDEATHCEVKLHGFRKTQDGVVVSFVVHPSEVPSMLALDPLGTRYMLALAAIDEDGPSQEIPLTPARERYRNLSEMEQARARAGMLPSVERFREWAGAQDENDAANLIRLRIMASSRSRIADDPQVYRRFMELETKYLIDTQQMATPR